MKELRHWASTGAEQSKVEQGRGEAGKIRWEGARRKGRLQSR